VIHRVVFAPEAQRQLVDLYMRLAAVASAEIADAYVGAILQTCESLRMLPLRGTSRDDIRPGLRTFGFRKRATIAFEVTGESVTILGVFYGGQDFETMLEG
jgi:toxin ParE1/3/4